MNRLTRIIVGGMLQYRIIISVRNSLTSSARNWRRQFFESFIRRFVSPAIAAARVGRGCGAGFGVDELIVDASSTTSLVVGGSCVAAGVVSVLKSRLSFTPSSRSEGIRVSGRSFALI